MELPDNKSTHNFLRYLIKNNLTTIEETGYNFFTENYSFRWNNEDYIIIVNVIEVFFGKKLRLTAIYKILDIVKYKYEIVTKDDFISLRKDIRKFVNSFK